MKRIILILSFGLLLILAFNSCYYDNMEVLYPPAINTQCDTANVTFSGTIKPFLKTYCLDCHSNVTASAAKNIRLQDYADVVTNADKSLSAINWRPGVLAMPLGALTKLDNCSIKQFQLWVKDGKPNN